jgi:integrase
MPSELRSIDRKLPLAERQRLQSLAATWRAQHCGAPNQLRHATATEVRAKFGVEVAQTVLGHARADVTQAYAERNPELAKKVAKQLG